VVLRGLWVGSCRMEGAERFIRVDDDGAVVGGVFSGCTFGEFVSTRSRVFSVAGGWDAVVVRGCTQGDAAVLAERLVWELLLSATVNRSADMFNTWRPSLKSGAKADRLVALTSTSSGGLETSSTGTRFETENMGFFDEVLTTRAEYRYASTGFSDARYCAVEDVLGTLLLELSTLGLITTP